MICDDGRERGVLGPLHISASGRAEKSLPHWSPGRNVDTTVDAARLEVCATSRAVTGICSIASSSTSIGSVGRVFYVK